MTSSRVFAAALLVSGASMQGCISNLQPLDITNFDFLSTTGGMCGATAGSGSDQEVYGVYDTKLAALLAGSGPLPGYTVGMTVTSELIANNVQPVQGGGVTNAPVVDSSQADLKFATVQYAFAKATGQSVSIPDRSFPSSVTVLPGQDSTFPQQIFDGALDGSKLQGATGTLIATVSLGGNLADGSGIAVTPANFNIEICDGCLMNSTATGVLIGGAFCPQSQVLTTCGIAAAAQPDGLACATAAQLGADAGPSTG